MNNPHLFKSKILRVFETQKEAQIFEIKLQKNFNVITNPMYINKGIGGISFNTKGRKVITNGSKEYMHIPSEPMPEGFRYGRNEAHRQRNINQKGKKHNISEEGLAGIRAYRASPENPVYRLDVKAKIAKTLTGRKKRDYYSSQEEYDIAMKKSSDWMLENNPFRGKKHSEKSNKQNSDAHKGMVVAKDKDGNLLQISKEEFDKRDDLVGSQSGLITINDGFVERKIQPNVAIPAGWLKGRSPKNIQACADSRNANRLKKSLQL